MSDVSKPTEVGLNRTGTATSSMGYRRLSELIAEDVPPPDETPIYDERLSYCDVSEPVGTMPPPVKLSGMASDMLKRLSGERITILLDKIGERLAYERTGVRLYEALLVKLAASHSHDSTITDEAIGEIRADELRHAGILATALEKLGGDPTAVTPGADVVGVAGAGYMAVLTDPKTTLTQCLSVMLGVELGDLASWELLVELANQLDQEELADQFRIAAEEEASHEKQVRRWLRVAVLGQADEGLDPKSGRRH